MINLLEKHSWVLTATLSAVALLYAFLLFLPTQSDICELRVERNQKQAFIANELKMREEQLQFMLRMFQKAKLEETKTYASQSFDQ